MTALVTPTAACTHVFSAAAPLELGQWGFTVRCCETCGAVLLVHDEEPLATEDALRNAEAALDELGFQLEEAVEELAAFRAREVSAFVLALDRGWPAIALVLALEERPRFFTTALTDEETQRLVAWLTRDPAAGFLAELTFELTGSGR